MADIKLLELLSNAPGVPGFEGPVAEIVDAALGFAERRCDRLGGRVFDLTSKSKDDARILIEAHMDEVGFMVAEMLPSGLIVMQSLGGWVQGSVQGGRFNVHTRSEAVIGGVAACIPSHFAVSADQQKKTPFLLDVGAKNITELNELGIELGNAIAADVKFSQREGIATGKAFDNRVGCAMVVEAMTHFKTRETKTTLVGGFSVQEELGVRGAKAIAELSSPDVAIVLEGAPADDFPGLSANPQTRMGGGAHVRLYDPTLVANPRLANWIIDLAKSHGIRHQPAVRRVGGTDGRDIMQHGIGVPTIVLGVPVRYAHSPGSVIDLTDYDACLALLINIIDSLDADLIKSFI